MCVIFVCPGHLFMDLFLISYSILTLTRLLDMASASLAFVLCSTWYSGHHSSQAATTRWSASTYGGDWRPSCRGSRSNHKGPPASRSDGSEPAAPSHRHALGVMIRLMEHSNISRFCWELVTQNGSDEKLIGFGIGAPPRVQIQRVFHVNYSRCADTEV